MRLSFINRVSKIYPYYSCGINHQKFKNQSLEGLREIFYNHPPFTVFVVSSNCNMPFMTHYLFVSCRQFRHMKHNYIIHLIYLTNGKYYLDSFIKFRSPELHIKCIEVIFAIPWYLKTYYK